MFITAPGLALPVPAPLLPPGGKAWRAVEVAPNFPWFILTVETQDDDESIQTHMLFSRGEDIARLVTEQAAPRLCALQYIEPPAYSSSNGWRIRPVLRLWSANAAQLPIDAVILEDDKGFFWEPLLDLTAEQLERRTLLVDLHA
jgi:hypothetical protein